MIDKIHPLREIEESFATQKTAYVKALAFLETLYDGTLQREFAKTKPGGVYADQDWQAHVGPMRVPSAKAAWNALVMLGQAARTDAEKAEFATCQRELRDFFNNPDIGIPKSLLFDPFDDLKNLG